MPGIVGIIRKGLENENAVMLDQMVQSMMHEPFYNSKTYSNDSLGIHVGWVGHTGSFSDRMPVWNRTRDICLMFSGEDVSATQEEAVLNGKTAEDHSDDSNYLIRRYETVGLEFVKGLNGWFCGILADLRSREVFIFNDRYGLGRIYYHESKDGFYFSSEAKALLRVKPSLRQLDLTSLGEYFSCGCPLQNRTLYEGISLLPGAAVWSLSSVGIAKKDSYFRPHQWEDQSVLGEAEYYELLRETFGRILPRYFRGPQKIALSLTGGVDSRMVMAWNPKTPGMLPCYTFGGMFRDCNDVTIARQVATFSNQPHQVIPVGKEFLAQFHELARDTVYLTDGAMDVSGTPDLFVNRLAREIAPIRMTGNYGGEILRSIVAFKPMSLSQDIFSPELRPLARMAGHTYADELDKRRLSFVAFKQVPWHHYSRLSLELSQVTVRSPYLDNDLVELAFRVPPHLATSNDLSLRLISDGNSTLSQISTDRNVPFHAPGIGEQAKHWLEEFTFKAEYAFDYGMPHWLVKIDRTFSSLHLERLFLGRHKFYHFRYWYRHELGNYLKEILLDPSVQSRAYFDGRKLEKMVRAHTCGEQNFTLELHRALSIELIHKYLLTAK